MRKAHLSSFFTTAESTISKLYPNGWLAIWRLKNIGDNNSAIVPIFAHEGHIGFEKTENARTPLYAHRALKSYQALPGFCGMVYCMADKKFPLLHKIGHSKEAWSRMQQSPWRPELGRIPHTRRQIEYILACLFVESGQVETALHRSFKHWSYKIWGERGRGRKKGSEKGRGRGREWFYLDRKATHAGFQNEIYSRGEAIWIRGLAEASETGYPREDHNPSPWKIPETDLVVISQAEQDFRAKLPRRFSYYYRNFN